MSATSGKSCFQRKLPSKSVQINGTKISLSNSQLLVSTGIQTLDQILGGGIAVGSILLIEEDQFGTYAKLMLKYWLAEGVVSGHEVFLSSADSSPTNLLHELPDPINYAEKTSEVPVKLSNDIALKDEEDLKIAWRYKHLTASQTSDPCSQFGHYFDISKSMQSSLLDSAKKNVFDPLMQCDGDQTHCYSRLLHSIGNTLTQGNFSTSSSNEQRNVLRIALHSIGSAQWSQLEDKSFCQFMYTLRMLLRSSFAVCVMTVPTQLYERDYTERLHHVADAVIRLESFVGTKLEANPIFKEYNGLLHVEKLPQLNAMIHSNINTEDLAFKLRRKRFTIEKLHLPPALPDSDLKPATQSSQQQVSQSKSSCGSHLNQIVDF